MSLLKRKISKRDQPKPKTLFEMFFGEPKICVKIHHGKHRKVAAFGDTRLPIIDKHLIIHDEYGNVMAVCKRDLEIILQEIT